MLDTRILRHPVLYYIYINQYIVSISHNWNLGIITEAENKQLKLLINNNNYCLNCSNNLIKLAAYLSEIYLFVINK